MTSTGNPWKKYDTRLVYENPWIRVREDKVITPKGEHGIYGVVETRIATAVVALTERNEVYLVGQYRYPVEQYSWEVIEGGADQGEDPMAAAKRELREEAGLVAKEFTQVGAEIQLSNCFSSEIGYIYLARGLSEVAPEPDDTEILIVKKVPFEEALHMVDQNEIKDGLSIMALLKLQRQLNGTK